MANYPTVDSAIAQFEGFNKPGTIAQSQNNPGDIVYGGFARSYGATGAGAKGIAVFPDVASGNAAEDGLVTQYADSGFTIAQLISSWSPPNAPGNTPEATQNYINFVSGKLGVTPDTPVASLKTGSTPSTGSTVLDGIKGGIAGALGPMGLAAGLAPSFSWGRVAAFFLGLIFIGAGLYLFKPVQTVVNTTAKGAIAAL